MSMGSDTGDHTPLDPSTSDEQPRVAFIGLGNMGLPIAKNLVNAGVHVTGYDIDDSRVEELARAGGHAAASIPAGVETADVVFTMVRTPEQVQAIAVDAFPAAQPNTYVVDMSTVGPDAITQLAELAGENGLSLIDAPVSGGVVGAEAGTLAVMAGGDPDAFAAVEPLLEILGGNVVRVGELGAGQTAKLCNQLLVGSQLAAIAEAFRLADAADLDLETLYDVLTSGVATSGILEVKGERILDADYEPGADIDIQHKDTQMVMELGKRLDEPLYSTAIVNQAFIHARKKGYGSLDHLILYELFNDDADF